MHVRRLTMDLDYADLAIKRGSPAELDELFDSMAAAGFHATIMACSTSMLSHATTARMQTWTRCSFPASSMSGTAARNSRRG